MMVSKSTKFQYRLFSKDRIFTDLFINIVYTIVYFMVILISFSDHPYTYLSNTVTVCNKRMPIPYLCWKVYTKRLCSCLKRSYASFSSLPHCKHNSLVEDPFFFTIKVWGSYLWHNVWHRSRIPVIHNEEISNIWLLYFGNSFVLSD